MHRFIVTRKLNVSFVFQYTQSINTLKRLMMQADSDYYALYRYLLYFDKSQLILKHSFRQSKTRVI